MIRVWNVLIVGAAVGFFACSAASQKDPAIARRPQSENSGENPPPAEQGPPTEELLSLYQPIALYEILPVNAGRADYSGITIRSEDSSRVTVWLCNDKPEHEEDAIFRLTLTFPDTMAAEPVPVRPERLPVANPRRLATGEDIEDLGWVPALGDTPGVLAVVGERGPARQNVSWFYLMTEKGDSLELLRSQLGSPPGESVGNDGLEGVAIRRLDAGRIETFRLKERPMPTYILRDLFRWDGRDYVPVEGPDSAGITTITSQSGACIPPAGHRLSVVDRSARRIAILDLNGGSAVTPWSNLDARILEWIDYSAVDGVLEGRSSDAPPSLYGAVEGIAEDDAGRLYLMSDNNEARNSRLIILRRK